MRKGLWLIGLAVAVLAFAAPASADNLTVRLLDFQSGQPIIQCKDGDPCDGVGTAGYISFSGVFGTFGITTGTGSGMPYTPAFDMDLSYNMTQGRMAPKTDTYVVMVSENDLTSPSPVQWYGFIGGTNVTTRTSWTVYVDPNNGLFVQTTPLCTGTSAAAGFTSVCAQISPFSPSGPFSLTQAIYIESLSSGYAQASGDFYLSTNPIPEPGTLVLLATGMVALAAWRMKK
jgi:hypothetical protein